MLLEVPPHGDEPPRSPRLTLVVGAAVTPCLYCEEELEFAEDLWCPDCEEPEDPPPAA